MPITLCGKDWKAFYAFDNPLLGRWIDANSLVYSVNGEDRNFTEDDLCPYDSVDDDDVVIVTSSVFRDDATNEIVGDVVDELRRSRCAL